MTERTRRKSGRPGLAQRPAKQAALLCAFSELGSLRGAEVASGVSTNSHRRWMHDDPTYPNRFYEAEDQAVDRLEDEARRRAMGYVETITETGPDGSVRYTRTIQRYSDRLLEVLLRARRPEVYREKYEPTDREQARIQLAAILGIKVEQLPE